MPVDVQPESGLKCAKCGFVNPPEARNHCRRCGAHLRIACRHCGHGNPRIAERCAVCGRDLHRNFWQRISHWTVLRFGRTGALVFLGLAVIVIALGVFWALRAQERLRRPAPTERPTPDEIARKLEYKR
jgi:ribosomal protein L40E